MSRITVILFILLLSGCSKGKPREGEYSGVFTYDCSKKEKTGNVEISDPSKDFVAFNGNVVEKDGKRIFGKIGSIPNVGTGITIDAEWKHRPFTKKYTISGTFYYNIYYLSGGPPQKVTGTFSLSNY